MIFNYCFHCIDHCLNTASKIESNIICINVIVLNIVLKRFVCVHCFEIVWILVSPLSNLNARLTSFNHWSLSALLSIRLWIQVELSGYLGHTVNLYRDSFWSYTSVAPAWQSAITSSPWVVVMASVKAIRNYRWVLIAPFDVWQQYIHWFAYGEDGANWLTPAAGFQSFEPGSQTMPWPE